MKLFGEREALPLIWGGERFGVGARKCSLCLSFCFYLAVLYFFFFFFLVSFFIWYFI